MKMLPIIIISWFIGGVALGYVSGKYWIPQMNPNIEPDEADNVSPAYAASDDILDKLENLDADDVEDETTLMAALGFANDMRLNDEWEEFKNKSKGNKK